MLLLGRQAYWMNDSLEKMYPVLRFVKLSALSMRVTRKDTLRRTYSKIREEVAEALYMDWITTTRGVKKMEDLPNKLERNPSAVVSEVKFKDLLLFEKEPFIRCAQVLMEIIAKDDVELVQPLRKTVLDVPRKSNMEFVHSVNEKPVLVVIRDGEYVYVHRRDRQGR